VSLPSFVAQLLNGLAGASALFLVAAGLTLIFGVTRVVNFAHGSLYMLGAYIAYTLVAAFGGGALGFWGAVVACRTRVAAIGAAIKPSSSASTLRRNCYSSPQPSASC
jgi:branched-chain amino acid transport system permease protein